MNLSKQNPSRLLPTRMVSVVVPVYGNAGSLPMLFERLSGVETILNSRGYELDLIFVVDGSPDASLVALHEHRNQRPATTVVNLARNFGAVHASKCGLGFAKGDCFMVLAADLQDPPELLLEMIGHWENGHKFVVCERISRDDPFLSKLYSTIFYVLVRKIVMAEYPARGYDMALMDKSILIHITQSSKNMFTPLLAYWLGYKPIVITYERQKRLHGKSGWTFKKKLKSFLDVMLGFSAAPIRIMSCIGLISATCGFLYGAVVILNAILGNAPVPGFATLVAIITFLLGIVIIMLGVIGEYLWRIFDEVNKRPEVVVDAVYAQT